MDPEEALKSLRNAVQPTSDARLRIKMKMHARIKSTHLRASLSGAQGQPLSACGGLRFAGAGSPRSCAFDEAGIFRFIAYLVRHPVRNRASIRPSALRQDPDDPPAATAYAGNSLSPSAAALGASVCSSRASLYPVDCRVCGIPLVVRLSPLLFIAPHSIAQSPFMLLPTRGSVSILIGGVWQPVTEEMSFTKSALIRTEEGEATLVLHDDGVIRLGAEYDRCAP